MKDNKLIMFGIFSILIIQLGIMFSNELRLHRIEAKIDQFCAPIENVELPIWEDNP